MNSDKYTVKGSQRADQGGESPRLVSGYMVQQIATFEAGEKVVMLSCVKHQYNASPGRNSSYLDYI